MNLHPDLQDGILPISAASSQLARRIDQARRTRRPIAITQKGRPTAVLLPIELFTALRELAEAQEQEQEES